MKSLRRRASCRMGPLDHLQGPSPKGRCDRPVRRSGRPRTMGPEVGAGAGDADVASAWVRPSNYLRFARQLGHVRKGNSMPQVRWPAHRVDDAPCRPRRWFEVAAAHLLEGADPPVGWLEREAGDPDLRDRADRLAGHRARGILPNRRSGSPSVRRGLRRSAPKPSHAAVRLCGSQAQVNEAGRGRQFMERSRILLL